MSRSVNRVTLMGNVGADPEIRTTTNGGRVANFSVATTRQWSSQSGEKQEKTEWHKCVAWDNAKGAKLADIVEKYVKKGDKIYIEGRIEYRDYQDKENQKRYVTEVIVNELVLIGGRGGSSGGGDDSRPARSAAPAKAKAAGAAGGDFEEFDGAEGDDDLPF